MEGTHFSLYYEYEYDSSKTIPTIPTMAPVKRSSSSAASSASSVSSKRPKYEEDPDYSIVKPKRVRPKKAVAAVGTRKSARLGDRRTASETEAVLTDSRKKIIEKTRELQRYLLRRDMAVSEAGTPYPNVVTAPKDADGKIILDYVPKPHHESLDVEIQFMHDTEDDVFDEQTVLFRAYKKMMPSRCRPHKLHMLGHAIYRIACSLVPSLGSNAGFAVKLNEIRLALLKGAHIYTLDDVIIGYGYDLSEDLEKLALPEVDEDDECLEWLVKLRSVGLMCMRAACCSERLSESGKPYTVDGMPGACASAFQTANWLGLPVFNSWMGYATFVDLWHHRLQQDTTDNFSTILVEADEHGSCKPSEVLIFQANNRTTWSSVRESSFFRNQWRLGKRLTEMGFMQLMADASVASTDTTSTADLKALTLADFDKAYRWAKLLHRGDGAVPQRNWMTLVPEPEEPEWTAEELALVHPAEPKLKANESPLISDVHLQQESDHFNNRGTHPSYKLTDMGHALMLASHMNVRFELFEDVPLVKQRDLIDCLLAHFAKVGRRPWQVCMGVDLTRMDRERFYSVALRKTKHGVEPCTPDLITGVHEYDLIA
ncbi:protein ORF9 [Cyprinid herpesvirus 3]|nr:protein ORF9 [Cyprinid herpesvirus 3]